MVSLCLLIQVLYERLTGQHRRLWRIEALGDHPKVLVWDSLNSTFRVEGSTSERASGVYVIG